MINWIIDDLLQQNAPKLIGALMALGAAHSDLLKSWGVPVDWNTLGGKLTTAVLVLLGMLAGHHTTKAVTSGGGQ